MPQELRGARPPRLKRWSPPGLVKIVHPGQIRSSPRTRGYDRRWDKLSKGFRAAHILCLFCEQEGRDTLAQVTDHILPAKDWPAGKYDADNLCALCKKCHDGLKQALENEARARMDIHLLRDWVAKPRTRPRHLLAPMFCEGVNL